MREPILTLNAAEVSVTRWLVCGYRTDWASMFLSCPCRATELLHSCAGQPEEPAVTWASTLLFLCPRTELTSDSSFCRGILTERRPCALSVIPQQISQDISLLSRVRRREKGSVLLKHTYVPRKEHSYENEVHHDHENVNKMWPAHLFFAPRNSYLYTKQM